MKELKRNAKGQKLYPFSMKKYGHDILLAYNIQKKICWDMGDGLLEMYDDAFRTRDEMAELYAKVIGDEIAWVTGSEYAKLKSWATLAGIYRIAKNQEG